MGFKKKSVPTCQLPGCNQDCFYDNSQAKYLDYCGRNHAQQHQQQQQQQHQQQFSKTTVSYSAIGNSGNTRNGGGNTTNNYNYNVQTSNGSGSGSSSGSSSSSGVPSYQKIFPYDVVVLEGFKNGTKMEQFLKIGIQVHVLHCQDLDEVFKLWSSPLANRILCCVSVSYKPTLQQQQQQQQESSLVFPLIGIQDERDNEESVCVAKQVVELFEKKVKRIYFYDRSDPYYEFTNFYQLANNTPFVIEGRNYLTTEHYFQSQKFEDKQLQKQIVQTRTARDAFDTARANNAFKRRDWDQLRNEVMYTALKCKFQIPSLALLLLSTGDAELIEHTDNDSYWADGGIKAKGIGQNQLGKTLKRVRTEMKKYINNNTSSLQNTISFETIVKDCFPKFFLSKYAVANYSQNNYQTDYSRSNFVQQTNQQPKQHVLAVSSDMEWDRRTDSNTLSLQHSGSVTDQSQTNTLTIANDKNVPIVTSQVYHGGEVVRFENSKTLNQIAHGIPSESLESIQCIDTEAKQKTQFFQDQQIENQDFPRFGHL